MKLPLVDVYLLSYRRPHFLRLMLESLVGQDYPSIRITVIDNASTPETREILIDYANRYENFCYRAFSDSGFDRLNIPLLWSDAEFIFVPHDDDVVASDWVSRAVGILESMPTVAAIFSRHHVIDDSGVVLDSETFGYPPGVIEVGSFVGHHVMTGELPLCASGIYRMSTITTHNIRFENPRNVGVALDVQILRDINSVAKMYFLDYRGYYYRTHRDQTAITRGFDAACSDAYIISAHKSTDVKIARQMLLNLANLSLCQPSPVSKGYKLAMRILRWLCKHEFYIPTKILNLAIAICRRNLGDLVLHR
jgi:glycosyltransferase involved in cell wall biosynthesis